MVWCMPPLSSKCRLYCHNFLVYFVAVTAVYGFLSNNTKSSIVGLSPTLNWISHVVSVIQVKVSLNVQLKLIVISLSIHMMTSQDRICVQCVTNGLHRKEVWIDINQFILQRSHLYVQCVTNDLHRKNIWKSTKELTLERSILYVQCVTNGLHRMNIWNITY